MANFKNTNRELITTKRTVPLNSTKTGTISIVAGSKEVVGVGTLFLSEAKVGDWIIDFTNNELRQIESIENDLYCIIKQGFTNAFVAAATIITPKSDFVEISYLALAASNIDGAAVTAGEYGGWGKNSRERSAATDFCDPVIFDGATGNFVVLTLKG